MKNDPIIQIEDVSFQYNHELVLEDINIDVRRGEFLGVIGPNGSGKTTLLKILLGLLKPTKGRIMLFGQEINKFNNWEKIGYVPQKAGSSVLGFPITVEEIVSMGLVGKNINKKTSVRNALESVEMHGFGKKKIGELSGGEQQRAFIARALVSSPELLILDEPTAGVDSEVQNNFYMLLRKLNKDLGITLVLVSHDIDVVTNEVTTIACINKKLICHLPPKDFNKEDYLEEVYGKNQKYVIHVHKHD